MSRLLSSTHRYTRDILAPFCDFFLENGLIMENTIVKAVQVTKFSGHSHEDPVKFLDELDSYLIIHGIKLNAADRRCSALHLHL